MQNLINFNLDREEKTAVDEALATLRRILLPKLVNLSPGDIRNMVNMGNKNMGFVTKAAEIAHKYPHLVPEFFDLEAFQTDLDATVTLRDLKLSTESLSDLINDSLALSGSEALQAALSFYSYLKIAVKMNVPEAETAYLELAEHFPRKAQKSSDEETTEESA
ncbi:MAG: hypothetical protein K9H65_06130 [Bacteroidales bacterium]|nr:hypothetical protein [Bacteroidales bacterium]